MTATERLRELLDERGVKHYDDTETKTTFWLKDRVGYRASADEGLNGYIQLHLWCTAPGQAITATLGSGTCEVEETDLMPFVRADSDGSDVDYIHVMECSACGGTYEYVNGSYEFCPRCGREVVDE